MLQSRYDKLDSKADLRKGCIIREMEEENIELNKIKMWVKKYWIYWRMEG
ncbi:MAG: hypothetical protein WC120_03505 [Parcubacteria group bacterium]